MRKVLVVAALVMLAVQPAFAGIAKPTAESVNQLFAVMHTSELLDDYVTQIELAMRTSMRQRMQGAQLNPEQQQIMADMGAELVGLLRQEVNWESMRPMMVEVYRNTFSQREVDDMLKFYRSPSGQAVVSKLPAAMKQATQAMQEHVSTLTPKIMQLQKDTAAALKRAQERPAASAPPFPSAQSPESAQPPPTQTPAPQPAAPQ